MKTSSIIPLVLGICALLLLTDCRKKYHDPLENPENGPAAGNPDGNYPVPAEADLEDISNPDVVIGNGSPESCDCQAVKDGIAQGGTIVFDCGDQPLTIEMDEPAVIYNDANPDVVIDGGGLITLSGRGKNRILYMNTCDEELNWTTVTAMIKIIQD